MTSQSGVWLRLIHSTAGNTLPLAAIAMLLSAGLIGGGVDISRAYLAQNRLQAACDAGVLAGRKAVKSDGYDETAEDAAKSYFAANFDQTNEGSRNTIFNSESEDNGNTVSGSATAELDTTIMKIFGMKDFDLSVSCSASLGVGNSDIMMVLDTTGSMAWTADGDTTPDAGETTRLQDLKAAMKNFFTTVAEATSDSNARIRYGFVPYSSSVNVGKLIRAANPDYMAETYTVQTRSWYKWGAAQDHGTGSGYTAETTGGATTMFPSHATLEACQAALPADTDWADNGAPTTPNTTTYALDADGNRIGTTVTSAQKQRKIKYACKQFSPNGNFFRTWRNVDRTSQIYSYTIQAPTFLTEADQPFDGLMYRQSSYDVSDLLDGQDVTTLTGSSFAKPALVTSKWSGCIEERQTTAASSFSYVPGEGITPSTALDLNIDSAPTDDDATKWKPMWADVAFGRNTDLPSTSGYALFSYCPKAAQLLAEMSEEDFNDYADTLTATGQTYHDLGMLWGARLSSPTGIWQGNVAEEPDNGGAVSRHLIFMTDGELAPSDGIQSSYGMERRDKRVSAGGDGSYTELFSRHRSRFLALCQAVKGRGIRLWVISFGTALTDDLKTCASSSSSFAASDAGQLNDAFQKIAKQVGELRVTQ